MVDRSSAAAARNRLLERLQPVTAAWSVNGRDVHLAAQFDLSIEPGDLLVVTPPDGERLLVQLHELNAVTRSGVTVDLGAEGLGLQSGDESFDDYGFQRARLSVQVRT